MRVRLLTFLFVLLQQTAAPGRTGTVAKGSFASPALGVTKHYQVWLPAVYAASKLRYPVIYMLHGLGGHETDWLRAGHLDQAADQLGLEAIVVMPDGDDGFYVNWSAPVDYDAC